MSFNDDKVQMDHYKEDVTYGEVRAIAEEAVKAAESDPNGEQLLLGILQGGGPLVVVMVKDLALTVSVLMERLEAAQEVAA